MARILIAEDEPDMMMGLRDNLQFDVRTPSHRGQPLEYKHTPGGADVVGKTVGE